MQVGNLKSTIEKEQFVLHITQFGHENLTWKITWCRQNFAMDVEKFHASKKYEKSQKMTYCWQSFCVENTSYMLFVQRKCRFQCNQIIPHFVCWSPCFVRYIFQVFHGYLCALVQIYHNNYDLILMLWWSSVGTEWEELTRLSLFCFSSN